MERHQEPHQERRQDNEIDERLQVDDQDEEDEEDGSLNPSLPAGRDTYHQLTTERSSWRVGRNGVNRPAATSLIRSISIMAVCVGRLIPFGRFV